MSRRPEPITVIILSRNRPIYLWACLDSLYRFTRFPARFVLVDNQSTDPGVRDVVAGFERRGLFHAVEWHDHNDPKRVLDAVRRLRDGPGDKIVVIESDVVVFDTHPCWLTRMQRLMKTNPEVGLLGSYLDTRDFISRAEARRFMPNARAGDIDRLIKSKSPERQLTRDPPTEPLIDPFNPPGRLIMARKSVLDDLMFAADAMLYEYAREAGVQARIATTVRHRHLSLLNAFDYAEYDTEARDEFFRLNRKGVPVRPEDEGS